MQSSEVDEVIPPPPVAIATTARRRRWRMWTVLGAVAVLVIGGTVTAFAVSFHYLHAQGLDTGGGFGWLPPDNLNTRSVRVGPYEGLIIPARPNRWQTFSIDVQNNSSVTQTILGLTCCAPTAEPERLTVSTTNTATGDPMSAHYTSKPVALAPGDYRTVRLSHYAGGCWIWGHTNSRSEYYTDLDLRVRVGAFTRTETLDFSYEVFELRGAGSSC